MNWFKLHLNLTAVIGLITLLISVALCAGVVHWSDSDWLWFDGVAAIATISMYVLCAWILQVKGRSLLWLLIVGIAFPIGFTIFLILDNLNQPKREIQNPEYQLIGNSSTRIFHDPLCKQVRGITDETETWFGNTTEAINRGYSACNACNPPAQGSDEAETLLLTHSDSELKDARPTEGNHLRDSPDSFIYDCPQCGCKVQDDWKVCPNCGEALFEDHA